MSRKYSEEVIYRAFELRFKEQLSLPDIVEITGIPPSTLKQGFNGNNWNGWKQKWNAENPNYPVRNINSHLGLTLDEYRKKVSRLKADLYPKKENALDLKNQSVFVIQSVTHQINSLLEQSVPRAKKEDIKKPSKYDIPCRTQYGMNYVSIYEAAKHLKFSIKEIYKSLVKGIMVGPYVFYRSSVAENCFM